METLRLTQYTVLKLIKFKVATVKKWQTVFNVFKYNYTKNNYNAHVKSNVKIVYLI